MGQSQKLAQLFGLSHHLHGDGRTVIVTHGVRALRLCGRAVYSRNDYLRNNPPLKQAMDAYADNSSV
jgi:hypothetical protein